MEATVEELISQFFLDKQIKWLDQDTIIDSLIKK